MNLRRIYKNVFYSGVNDRKTTKFEGLWPLPMGVSYNSYIVKGEEKTALIDTVEYGVSDGFLKNLKESGIVSDIDYLIVNHMEPDHSGGIPELIKEFPNIKIIGNKITIGMIKGFYAIPDEYFKEIKDGELLDLGKDNLRFILTPMVHWPETMMTYHEKSKTLFSGDAFGCYGALNGGITDSEMDTDPYIEEVYRYYSTIVGKYGKFVQKALEKTKDLEIDYLCSTHGPVWHDRKSEIISIYDKLSKYEAEEGVTIVYGSMYGHTTQIAEIIANRLNEKGIRKIRIHDASKSDLSQMITDAFRYKGLIVGSPTYSMHIFPPVESFMISMETREIKNKFIAFFGSFTWSSGALKELDKYGEIINNKVIGRVNMKQSVSHEVIQQSLELADKMASAILNK